MKLLAIDNGYLYTKDSSHNIFKSAFTTIQSNDILSENDFISIDNHNYYYGVGNICTDINKISSDVNKITTLTSIAKHGDGDYILMLNLPIVQYKLNKDSYKQVVLNYNNSQLVYNDKQIKYNIREVCILPQGVSPIYSINPTSESIIIDIGSNTINFSLFEYVDNKLKLTKFDTKFKGLLHLYKLVINEINAKYTLNYDDMKAQYFLAGNPLIIDGISKDTTFIQSIIRDYMLDILSDFKLSFPYKTTTIYICGGGAELLYPIFNKNFPSAIKVLNPQFANVDGMFASGKQLYDKYIR